MLRSKLLWKLYASYALLLLATVAVARFAASATVVAQPAAQDLPGNGWR